MNIGLGDWVPAKTETPVEVTSTGYYYVDTLHRFPRSPGSWARRPTPKHYAELAEQIRAVVPQEVLPRRRTVANNSQTALSCALYQGLALPEEKEAILKQLVANVQRHNGHLDTGILGAKYLLHALTDNGRADVAYRIATQTTPPSYGSWIDRGATTLWEDWGDGGLPQSHHVRRH